MDTGLMWAWIGAGSLTFLIYQVFGGYQYTFDVAKIRARNQASGKMNAGGAL